jgi:hypothetical protein
LRRIPRALPGLGALIALLLFAGCPSPKPRQYHTRPRATAHFVILGDVRPKFALNLSARNNDRERAVLIREVAARRPAFVAIHGDLVFRGSSARQWAWFDQTFAPLRWARIPILPALGNHEYVGDDEEALDHYFARFPDLQRQHWYRRDLGELAILVLDSNREELGAKRWAAQLRWLAGQLRSIDADPKLRGAVVFVHHPVITNSSRHKGYPALRKGVMPLFVQARKTLALVAGHVHTYERFARHGKVLLNTGGGGAPRRKLLRGKSRRHHDDLFDGPALRPFHFLMVELTPTGLRWTAHGLRAGAEKLHLMERFSTPYPPMANARPRPADARPRPADARPRPADARPRPADARPRPADARTQPPSQSRPATRP